jgi:hypothetical protein
MLKRIKCVWCKKIIKEKELVRVGFYGKTTLHKKCVNAYYKKYGEPYSIDLHKYL